VRSEIIRATQALRGLREMNLLLLPVVHIVARTVSMSRSTTSPAAVFIIEALIFSQVALLVFWIMTPGQRWWSRILAIALCLLLFVSIESSKNVVLGRHSEFFALRLALVESIAILIALIACRGFGFAIRAEHLIRARPFHFSLKSLIGLTTLAAIGMWSIQRARAHMPTEAVEQRTFVLCELGCALAIVALAALWAVLVRRRWLFTIPVVALVAGLLGAVVAYVGKRPEEAMPLSLWLLAHAGLMIGSLLVVRASGWQFGRSIACRKTPVAPGTWWTKKIDPSPFSWGEVQ
jgi:hypothetical protein